MAVKELRFQTIMLGMVIYHRFSKAFFKSLHPKLPRDRHTRNYLLWHSLFCSATFWKSIIFQLPQLSFERHMLLPERKWFWFSWRSKGKKKWNHCPTSHLATHSASMKLFISSAQAKGRDKKPPGVRKADQIDWKSCFFLNSPESKSFLLDHYCCWTRAGG